MASNVYRARRGSNSRVFSTSSSRSSKGGSANVVVFMVHRNGSLVTVSPSSSSYQPQLEEIVRKYARCRVARELFLSGRVSRMRIERFPDGTMPFSSVDDAAVATIAENGFSITIVYPSFLSLLRNLEYLRDDDYCAGYVIVSHQSRQSRS